MRRRKKRESREGRGGREGERERSRKGGGLGERGGGSREESEMGT